jgi:hypothetical protein
LSFFFPFFLSLFLGTTTTAKPDPKMWAGFDEGGCRRRRLREK